MPELQCPRCKTRTEFVELSPHVTSYCPVCDYPMFFVAEESPARAMIGIDAGFGSDRRSPGAAGRTDLNALECWFCHELNPDGEKAILCLRCGKNLHNPPPDPPTSTDESSDGSTPIFDEELDDEMPRDLTGWVIGLTMAVVLLVIVLVVVLLMSR